MGLGDSPVVLPVQDLYAELHLPSSGESRDCHLLNNVWFQARNRSQIRQINRKGAFYIIDPLRVPKSVILLCAEYFRCM